MNDINMQKVTKRYNFMLNLLNTNNYTVPCEKENLKLV